jgi:hypothetical protein
MGQKLLAWQRKVWLLCSFDAYYAVPTHFLQLQLPTADDKFLQYMQHMKFEMSSEACEEFGRNILLQVEARFATLDRDSACGSVVDTQQVIIFSSSQ